MMRIVKDNWKLILVTAIFMSAVFATRFVSFQLFHLTAELFSTVIAVCLFIIAWNTRQFSENRFLTFLGIAFLFVGIVDVLHACSYKGIEIIPGLSANEPTQLWIVARAGEAVSLLIAPLFLRRRLNVAAAMLIYGVITVILLLSIFVVPVFPVCYREPSGLTTFKRVAEYAICIILFAAMGHLYRKRRYWTQDVFVMLISAVLLTIFSEIVFTFYDGVYDLTNVLGHLLKIATFLLLYAAVVRGTLSEPYRNLFGELKKSKDDQDKLIAELKDALAHVKQLQGFLPICAECKQVRDDRGYWMQIEAYISEHSEAKFSHGLCPDCIRKLYPEYKEP
jgi:hypothetical protein